MVKRMATSVVCLPLMAFFLINGGIMLRFALIVVAAFGMYEFYKAIIGRYSMWMTIACFTAAGVYFAELPRFSDMSGVLMLLAAAIIACGILTVMFYASFRIPTVALSGTSRISNAALIFVSFFYVAFCLGFISLVRDLPDGVYVVWLIFISAWGSDTCAYFTGKTLGKRKLCPSLSPSKTVEGAIGGVLGAAVIAMIYALAITYLSGSSVEIHVLTFGIVTAIAAVLSIFGDLAASAIKRRANIKDFGNIFPGHGGVLDRFDSVLFTAPAIYIFCILI